MKALTAILLAFSTRAAWCCDGTLISYLISIGVNLILPLVIENFLDGKPPEGLQFSYIPIWLTLLCAGISVGVAILSGMRPAKRAQQR